MSRFTSVLRPFAALTAIALLAGGLAITPSSAPSAEAVSVSKVGTSVLSQLNKYRKAAGLKSVKATQDLSLYTQEVTEYYAKNGSIDGLNEDKLVYSPPFDADSVEQPFILRLKGTDKTKGIAAIAKKIKAASSVKDKRGIYADVNYGAIGYTTRGGYTYAIGLVIKYAVKLQVTAPVTISGTVAVGNTIRVRTKGWSPAGTTFTVRWYSGDDSIGSGTTLKLTPELVGKRVYARAESAKDGYSRAARRTAVTAPVALGTFAAKTPVVTGSRVVGGTLTVAAADWGPDDTTWAYRWYRNGKAISAATATSYTLTAADAGKRIDVKVAAKATGYKSVTRATATKKTTLDVFVTAAPTIAGTPAVGETLTARPTAWTPKPTKITYKWLRDGVSIPKATAKTYEVTAADDGHTIAVRVYGARDGFASTGSSSEALFVGAN